MAPADVAPGEFACLGFRRVRGWADRYNITGEADMDKAAAKVAAHRASKAVLK